MKKYIIIILVLLSQFSFAQEPIADSLVGIYKGNLYSKIENDPWTVINENAFEYVTNIDTENCYVNFDIEQSDLAHAALGVYLPFNTTYSYCSGTWNAYDPLFMIQTV